MLPHTPTDPLRTGAIFRYNNLTTSTSSTSGIDHTITRDSNIRRVFDQVFRATPVPKEVKSITDLQKELKSHDPIQNLALDTMNLNEKVLEMNNNPRGITSSETSLHDVRRSEMTVYNVFKNDTIDNSDKQDHSFNPFQPRKALVQRSPLPQHILVVSAQGLSPPLSSPSQQLVLFPSNQITSNSKSVIQHVSTSSKTAALEPIRTEPSYKPNIQYSPSTQFNPFEPRRPLVQRSPVPLFNSKPINDNRRPFIQSSPTSLRPPTEQRRPLIRHSPVSHMSPLKAAILNAHLYSDLNEKMESNSSYISPIQSITSKLPPSATKNESNLSTSHTQGVALVDLSYNQSQKSSQIQNLSNHVENNDFYISQPDESNTLLHFNPLLDETIHKKSSPIKNTSTQISKISKKPSNIKSNESDRTNKFKSALQMNVHISKSVSPSIIHSNDEQKKNIESEKANIDSMSIHTNFTHPESNQIFDSQKTLIHRNENISIKSPSIIKTNDVAHKISSSHEKKQITKVIDTTSNYIGSNLIIRSSSKSKENDILNHLLSPSILQLRKEILSNHKSKMFKMVQNQVESLNNIELDELQKQLRNDCFASSMKSPSNNKSSNNNKRDKTPSSTPVNFKTNQGSKESSSKTGKMLNDKMRSNVLDSKLNTSRKIFDSRLDTMLSALPDITISERKSLNDRMEAVLLQYEHLLPLSQPIPDESYRNKDKQNRKSILSDFTNILIDSRMTIPVVDTVTSNNNNSDKIISGGKNPAKPIQNVDIVEYSDAMIDDNNNNNNDDISKITKRLNPSTDDNILLSPVNNQNQHKPKKHGRRKLSNTGSHHDQFINLQKSKSEAVITEKINEEERKELPIKPSSPIKTKISSSNEEESKSISSAPLHNPDDLNKQKYQDKQKKENSKKAVKTRTRNSPENDSLKEEIIEMNKNPKTRSSSRRNDKRKTELNSIHPPIQTSEVIETKSFSKSKKDEITLASKSVEETKLPKKKRIRAAELKQMVQEISTTDQEDDIFDTGFFSSADAPEFTIPTKKVPISQPSSSVHDSMKQDHLKPNKSGLGKRKSDDWKASYVNKLTRTVKHATLSRIDEEDEKNKYLFNKSIKGNAKVKGQLLSKKFPIKADEKKSKRKSEESFDTEISETDNGRNQIDLEAWKFEKGSMKVLKDIPYEGTLSGDEDGDF